MQEIKKLLNLSKNNYYETHLSIINCILPNKLTPKEVEVLAAFMSLDDETTVDSKGKVIQHRFSSKNRKKVMDICGLAPQGLSNHIRSLIEKNFLLENEHNKVLTILPILLPEKEEQYYRFKLVNEN